MSDDSDDFGPLQADTPKRPRAIVPQSKPGSSREAGPSRVTNGKTRKKTASAAEPSDDEVQEIVLRNSKNHGQGGARGRRKQQKMEEVEEKPQDVDRDEDDEDSAMNDVQEIEPPRTSKVRGVAKKPASKVDYIVNTKVKGKQKARPGPASKTQRPTRQEPESMDVDDIEVPGDDDAMDAEEVEAAKEQANLAHAINTAAHSGTMAQTKSQLQEVTKQKERLEKRLNQSLQHIEDLERQLQELHQVRHTEPEQLMERMELQHKAELAARDDLNRQYADQLAQKEPLFHSGAGFEILTRGQMNKETQQLQRQIKEKEQLIHQCKQNLDLKDEKLKEKNKEIETLKEDKQIIKVQLDAEIERANLLMTKARQQHLSQSRPRAGGLVSASSDPKYSTIISFYEDLTNVIVPNMKSHPGKYPDTDDWVLNCCYTHRDVVNKRASRDVKSLSFNLRLCYDLKPGAEEPVTNKDQLAQSVHYIPLDLDKESPEFRKSLGFLGDNFTFERDQLSLFVRTLYDYMSGEDEENAERTDDEDSVQFVK
ncbi:hypothetical protein CPB84DRAFT_1841757 [Gymnopilus junonius]|uniref:Monopolin complex subunit Csm1/Pcs1 C-terminal domain-containing protein n=1 Tax=Gymnopilus junonius TaxID=109634 RepID=A0A9P5NZQ3_GYMJU|nr:hypothetical protein CPB84DRAFT_1841757 [Gymnopilus junonius]